jgi:hypothetical protein
MSTAFEKVVPIHSAAARALTRRDPEFLILREQWRERWIAAGYTCSRCDDAASVIVVEVQLCGDCFLLQTIHGDRLYRHPRRKA